MIIDLMDDFKRFVYLYRVMCGIQCLFVYFESVYFEIGWFEYFGGKVKCHWKNRCKTRPARLVKIFIEEGERTYFYERLVWSRKSRWFGWCAK